MATQQAEFDGDLWFFTGASSAKVGETQRDRQVNVSYADTDGLDDPDLALFKVAVERAEFWDSPSSMVVQLYGFVKAVAIGKRPRDEIGDNEKLSF
jgi:general stress protein 26